MTTIEIKSDITGTITDVVVEVGAQVAEDDTLMLIESMKMEMPVVAPKAGRVLAIHKHNGESVTEGELLVLLES